MELSPDGDCLPPWSPLESDLPAEAHPWKKDLGIKSYHMPVFNSKAALSDLPKFQVCVLLGKDPRQLIKTGLWSLRSQVQMIGSCATFWDYKNGNSNNYWLDMRAKEESWVRNDTTFSYPSKSIWWKVWDGDGWERHVLQTGNQYIWKELSLVEVLPKERK